MVDALEIILIIAVVGWLLLLQIRTRTGSLFPYLAIVILLFMLFAAVRIIGSLVGLVITLVLLCGVLIWIVARSGQKGRSRNTVERKMICKVRIGILISGAILTLLRVHTVWGGVESLRTTPVTTKVRRCLDGENDQIDFDQPCPSISDPLMHAQAPQHAFGI
jgi:hypothetical protein